MKLPLTVKALVLNNRKDKEYMQKEFIQKELNQTINVHCCRGGGSGTETLPFIGENGNWWIGDEDTGVKAQGPTGEQGPKGDKGEPGSQSGKLTYIGSAKGKSEFVEIDDTFSAYVVIAANATYLTRYTFTIPYSDILKGDRPVYYGSGLFGSSASNQSVTIFATATKFALDEYIVVGNDCSSVATLEVYGM